MKSLIKDCTPLKSYTKRNSSSFVSVTESEGSIHKHPYFTRSSVNRSFKSSSAIDCKSPSFDLDQIQSSSPIDVINYDKTVAIFRRRNFDRKSMDWGGETCGLPPNSFFKWFRIVTVIGCVGLLGFGFIYLDQKVHKSSTSFNEVKNDLCMIQNQMLAVKEEVQNVISSKEKTGQQLQVIEKLLKNMQISKTDDDEEFVSNNAEVTSENKNCSFVDSVVQKALNQYDADKTGKTDFALESAGGSVYHVRGTETYNPRGNPWLFLGISICESVNGPQTMLQAGVLPGECWAFKGSSGSAIIRLLGKVYINGVSLEHISKSVSPTGVIDTAPKEFSIWGLEEPNVVEGNFFGKFFYDVNGPSLQYFGVKVGDKPYQFVEFKVHSNYGHPDFTCVYRLRVHGSLKSKRVVSSGKP